MIAYIAVGCTSSAHDSIYVVQLSSNDSSLPVEVTLGYFGMAVHTFTSRCFC
jgi:hypothetical protein